MVKLRTLKNAARLRSLTDLCPIKTNTTRWSSKYYMAKRYLELEPKIKEIEETEDDVLFNRNRKILEALM